MFAKIVRVVVLLLLFYAVGLSTFNFVNSHEFSGMVGSDVGTLKGENSYIKERIITLESGVSLSHQAIKAIVIKVSNQDDMIHKHEVKVNQYRDMWLKTEKDLDYLNARVQQIEYNRTWEIRKKVWTNKTNLIRQGIWKE